MSFLVKQKTVIKNLEYFKIACKKNNVGYKQYTGTMKGLPIEAILTDNNPDKEMSLHSGYLVQDKDGYKLIMDSNGRYSSLTRRLGANGGKLMRDYAQEFIMQEMALQGGCVNESIEQPDGGILLKVTMP